jgi:cytidylate kinase
MPQQPAMHSTSAVIAMIAMDGPAASGKSTIGRLMAERLGFLHLDTGIMYRAVALEALRRDVAPDDADSVGALAESLPLEILPVAPGEEDGRICTVRIAGEDVTWALRSPAVERSVSAVSAHRRVREAMVARQREVGLRYGSGQGDKPGIVMVGRDIGTVVLPDAPFKIYLDASAEVRAQRRLRDLSARATPERPAPAYEQVLADIRARDAFDSTRAVSPLRPAADAHHVDTSGLAPEAVVERILGLLRQVALAG